MKKLLLLSVLFVGIFALSACGREQAQGVSDTRVVVGNTAATSGGLAFVGGPFRDAMIAYFNMVNEQGGIGGREIAYIQYDDQFDGAQGLALTQRLVEDDQVFALVGHFGTPTVGATRDYLNDIGIPRVYYATGISALFNPEAEGGARASFPVQPIFDAEGEVMIARAVGSLGASSVGVIYTNDDAGRGLLNGIQIRANMLGVNLTEVQVAPDASDMSTAAQTLLSAGVDVILLAANQVPASVAARALADAGSSTPVVTSYVNADATWLTLIEEVLVSYDVYASAWIDVLGSPDDLNTFVTEVSKIDPALAGNAFAFAGWIAAATFVEGLRRVGDGELTWESYIDAMESAPIELPFGVVVDYASNRRVGTQAMAFLKAGSTDGVLAWETIEPIQTITDILE